MCTNGVNVSQFKMMVEHLDDQVALDRRWTHKLYHTASDAGYEKTAATLKEVQSLLDDARALLTDALDAAEKDSTQASSVTVELV